MSQLDPISLEIFSNALRSITDETFIALMKSSYSTNIKERLAVEEIRRQHLSR